MYISRAWLLSPKILDLHVSYPAYRVSGLCLTHFMLFFIGNGNNFHSWLYGDHMPNFIALGHLLVFHVTKPHPLTKKAYSNLI